MFKQISDKVSLPALEQSRFFLGNVNLLAERSRSCEAGIDQSFSARHTDRECDRGTGEVPTEARSRAVRVRLAVPSGIDGRLRF